MTEPVETIDLKNVIRTIPDYPKPGIMFRDITSLIENPDAFFKVIEILVDYYEEYGIDKIAGLESRGFIFGAPMALIMELPFVLIRKKGKLPGKTVSQEYELEYGTDEIEVLESSIDNGDRVLLVDDLLATGGTMKAACDLVEKLGAKVVSTAFVIELPDLNGRKRIEQYDILSLVEFAGE